MRDSEQQQHWDDRLNKKPVPQSDRDNLQTGPLYPDLCERVSQGVPVKVGRFVDLNDLGFRDGARHVEQIPNTRRTVVSIGLHRIEVPESQQGKPGSGGAVDRLTDMLMAGGWGNKK